LQIENFKQNLERWENALVILKNEEENKNVW
jgi:hypothetical protein